MKITVLGSGAWGTALALLLLENGNDVTLWRRGGAPGSPRCAADRPARTTAGRSGSCGILSIHICRWYFVKYRWFFYEKYVIL